MAAFTKLSQPSSSFSAAAAAAPVAKKFVNLIRACTTRTLKFFALRATGGTLDSKWVVGFEDLDSTLQLRDPVHHECAMDVDLVVVYWACWLFPCMFDTVERAVLVVVVSVCSVWCLIFDPSRIILTKTKSEGGTASLWQSTWNDPSIFLKHFSAHYLCSSR